MSSTLHLDHIGIARVYELATRMSANGFELRDGARLVRCPSIAHPVKKHERDAHPSCKLTPSKDAWHCFSCGAGGKILALIIAAGKTAEVERTTDRFGRPLSTEALALAWLGTALGHEAPTLTAQPKVGRPRTKRVRLKNERIAGEYPYRDAAGVVRYYVFRIVGDGEDGLRDKTFEFVRPVAARSFEREWTIEERPYLDTQDTVQFTLVVIGGVSGPQRGIRCERRFPDGRVEHLARNRDDVNIIPYRLDELVPAVSAGRTILFVEGERDADTLRDLGFAATSTPFGSSFMPDPSWQAYFRGAPYLAILCDADHPGRRSAAAKAEQLNGAAKITTACDLWPHRNDGYDVTDFVREQRDHGAHNAQIRAALVSLLRQSLLARHPSDSKAS